MLNVVVPMAGSGSRFVSAGYGEPKPFIDVYGKTMIERVLDNLKLAEARYILIVRDEFLKHYQDKLNEISHEYGCIFVSVDKLTEGAACTVLLSAGYIDNQDPLLIANSDQIVEMELSSFLEDAVARKLNGSILTFYADHPKWSYARTDDKGYLLEVREKEVISEHATVGIYYFEKGCFFVNSAKEMIANNERVNNEFYVAPVYNYAVKNGLKIGIYGIEESQMFGLGTPEDLNEYLRHLKTGGNA